MRRSLWVTGSLALAAALMFGACPSPAGGDDTPTVNGVTVSPATATVDKGGNRTFSATVTGTGNPAQTVTWKVSGGGEGTTINEAGVLTVAAGETAASLTVTATSTVNTSKSGTATITVNGVTVTIDTVTISPDTASVAKGGSETFSATVTGTGNPPQTVTWSIVETNRKPGTAISAAGVLSVDSGETLASITVQAVSTFDTGKSGVKTIAITGGALSPDEMDDEDFGPSAVITRFTAGGVTEWNEAVEAIQGGGDDKNYVITLTGSFAIPGNSRSSGDYTFGNNVTGITVSLRGEKTLSLSSKGSLLYIGSGQTLALWESALQGSDDNDTSLVQVGNRGSLTMHSGEISGNSDSGVDVRGETATFTMNGGTISGNSGGGVYVWSGTFTMHSGEISGNSRRGVDVSGMYASSGTFTMNGGTISGNSGGGVAVNFGTFTMKGGTISGNSVGTSYSGGGVAVNGTFTMNGGIISDNSSGTGGGVSVSYGTFTMNSGTISGNSATGYYCDGGGVSVSDGTFTMNGGTISGNSTTGGGGGGGVAVSGIYVRTTFTMSGGTISGNSVAGYGSGGGVLVDPSGPFPESGGTFTKTGGTVYGNDADATDQNQILGSGKYGTSGHAVYKSGSPGMYRNTTAGPEVNINTADGTGLSTGGK